MRFVEYQNTAQADNPTADFGYKHSTVLWTLRLQNTSFMAVGTGNANEVADLEKTVDVVKKLQKVDGPTVVCWVLGSESTQDEADIQTQLDTLEEALEDDGALMTWQLVTGPTSAQLRTDANTFSARISDNGQTAVLPSLTMSRPGTTITYQYSDGQPIDSTAAAVGDTVSVRSGQNITQPGETFGGWKDQNGQRYQPGAVIEMPADGLTLTPLWGHVAVEKALKKDSGDSEYYSNELAQNAYNLLTYGPSGAYPGDTTLLAIQIYQERVT